ncbi:hypothetical protein Aph01nite_44580 [Acrocarpospora phusangensis]|uniref:Uncharacterized protein n=1 Tax=Acrocarpospora phusangensis TaxID=1070424 RepID=A0A919UQ84_9ACTN|nr:hypothetical protein [Acrocarpospora phusangensis]GIH26148.1 hypothetical protein Aph01nite_44580 [Acrocarpospora phusangensis]
MIDEMDLLRDLRDAEPVRSRAFEEARAVLRAAMAEEGVPETKTAARRRARWGVRRTVGFSAAGLVAAAAAAALVVTFASAPGKPPVTAAPTAAAPAAAHPILVELASDITSLPAEASGDATLEIRNQSPTSDELGSNGIGLFTDDGTYYWGYDKNALQRAVADRDGGDDLFKRDIAAALYAVDGDIDTARERMAVANIAPGTNPDAERTKIEKLKGLAKARGEKYVPPKPLTPEQQAEITDNHIWTNSIDALIAAPENPQVRAGVLRIMATMPNVKVTETTTAGQPTLTLVDSWSTVGEFSETLIINAGTGQPVALSSSGSDTKSSMIYYHSSRVTLADVEAGKF